MCVLSPVGDRGRSKKWKEMLRLPPVAQCLWLRDEIGINMWEEKGCWAGSGKCILSQLAMVFAGFSPLFVANCSCIVPRLGVDVLCEDI